MPWDVLGKGMKNKGKRPLGICGKIWMILVEGFQG
jgi:hypothetical protein